MEILGEIQESFRGWLMPQTVTASGVISHSRWPDAKILGARQFSGN
jgi:hypothetical protein